MAATRTGATLTRVTSGIVSVTSRLDDVTVARLAERCIRILMLKYQHMMLNIQH
jgi:hypothetical protein